MKQRRSDQSAESVSRSSKLRDVIPARGLKVGWPGDALSPVKPRQPMPGTRAPPSAEGYIFIFTPGSLYNLFSFFLLSRHLHFTVKGFACTNW